MNTKLITQLTLILLAVNIVACASAPIDGQIYSTQATTAQRAITQALQGAPLTEIWTNGRQYIFTAPLDNGWQYVVTPTHMTVYQFTRSIRDGGNYVSAPSMSEIARCLAAAGWTRIKTLGLPHALVEKISVLTTSGVPFISIVVFPYAPVYLLPDWMPVIIDG